MGDNGESYDTIDNEIISGMKSLVSMADIITPNITEASMLLDEKVKLDTVKDRKNVLGKLADMGPEKIVITSVPEKENKMSVIAYERKTESYWKNAAQLY